jgi:hypothetical protein
VNWRIALPLVGGLILILVSIGIWRMWNTHKTKDPLADVPPAVYQPQRSNSGNTLPVPAQPRR